jgi:nucleotide-binding universal stress UspA family protein
VAERERTDGRQVLSKVVVGVDGSDASLRALRWASHLANAAGSALEVVTAWNFPEHSAPLGLTVHVPFQEELVVEAHEKLDQIVADVLSVEDRRRAATKVVRGEAADVLLGEIDDAGLLVVGRHGHETLETLLMGSTSGHCARHAPCPVVVVP